MRIYVAIIAVPRGTYRGKCKGPFDAVFSIENEIENAGTYRIQRCMRCLISSHQGETLFILYDSSAVSSTMAATDLKQGLNSLLGVRQTLSFTAKSPAEYISYFSPTQDSI